MLEPGKSAKGVAGSQIGDGLIEYPCLIEGCVDFLLIVMIEGQASNIPSQA